MDLESIFSLASGLALPGWLLLIVAPWWRWSTQLIAPVLIPLVLALFYAYLMATGLGQVEGDFNSLAGVRELFKSDRLLLAGWIHYLAFDLFIGSWEVRDARRLGVPHFLVVPCLLLTLVAGPVGLALYFAVRGAQRKLWIDDAVAASVAPAATTVLTGTATIGGT
jgi:hypothetical protein